MHITPATLACAIDAVYTRVQHDPSGHIARAHIDAHAHLELVSADDAITLTLHIPWSVIWPCERWPDAASFHPLNHCPTRLPRRRSDPRDTGPGIIHPLVAWDGPAAERLIEFMHDPEQACGGINLLESGHCEESFTAQAWLLSVTCRERTPGFFFPPEGYDYHQAWKRLATHMARLLTDIVADRTGHQRLAACHTMLDVWHLLIRRTHEDFSPAKRAFFERESHRLVQALWVRRHDPTHAPLELPWHIKLDLLLECDRHKSWARAHRHVMEQLTMTLKLATSDPSGAPDAIPSFGLLVDASSLTGPLCLASTHLLEHAQEEGATSLLRLMTWRYMSDEERADTCALLANMRATQTGLGKRVLHEHAPHVWLPWPSSSPHAQGELEALTHTLINQGPWGWQACSDLLTSAPTPAGYHALEFVGRDLGWYAARGSFETEGLHLQWLAMWWLVMLRHEPRRLASLPHFTRDTHPLYLLWPYVSALCVPLCTRDHRLTRLYVRFVELLEPYTHDDQLPHTSSHYHALWHNTRRYALHVFALRPGEQVEEWEVEVVFTMLSMWATQGHALNIPDAAPWVAMAMVRLPVHALKRLHDVLARLADPDLFIHLDRLITTHPDEARRRFLQKEQTRTMRRLDAMQTSLAHLKGAVAVAHQASSPAGALSLPSARTRTPDAER